VLRRIPRIEQIKASPGADDLGAARAAPGGTAGGDATHPPSLSCHACGLEKINRRSRRGASVD
jgi:hypothetical protein